MENILNRFSIEKSIQEFEQKIKEYYFSLDDSITEVNVKYSPELIGATWNDGWERYLGGYYAVGANVEIIRQVNVFGEISNGKIQQHLGNDNLIHILSVLLEKDNLKVTSLSEDKSSSKIRIWCEEIINQNKQEVLPLGNGNSLKLKKI